MGKIWRNTRKDIRDFESWLAVGKTVYVINEHDTRVPGQFESHTYSARTCTGRHPIFGNWEIGHNTSAKGLVQWYGEVHETPPPGIRDLAGPEPDCRDEGIGYRSLRRGQIFRGRLDLDEIERMEGHAQDAEDEFQKEKAKRGKWF
ncbi:hypothetical protein OG818_30275 [Streptomyces virginiae]|uniref:hypothetical protein n=1 Tax=Streptomyces virginiae TaxID=1961 RepID=UPI00224C904E|nr:hypothetical protein [Streptomyces virginiae]MCX4720012.1 hypothetical protein [Streptomyces virginiae]